MKMHQVNGRMIESLGYDDDQNMLVVKFKTGRIIHYHGIDRYTFEDLLQSDAPDMYLMEHARSHFGFI